MVEGVGEVRYISAMVASHPHKEDDEEFFYMNFFNSKIESMKVTKEVLMLVRNKEQDIGTSDVPYLKNVHISEHHTDVTAYDLSDHWGIKLSQATITLKKTTQKLLHSAVFCWKGYNIRT